MTQVPGINSASTPSQNKPGFFKRIWTKAVEVKTKLGNTVTGKGYVSTPSSNKQNWIGNKKIIKSKEPQELNENKQKLTDETWEPDTGGTDGNKTPPVTPNPSPGNSVPSSSNSNQDQIDPKTIQDSNDPKKIQEQDKINPTVLDKTCEAPRSLGKKMLEGLGNDVQSTAESISKAIQDNPYKFAKETAKKAGQIAIVGVGVVGSGVTIKEHFFDKPANMAKDLKAAQEELARLRENNLQNAELIAKLEKNVVDLKKKMAGILQNTNTLQEETMASTSSANEPPTDNQADQSLGGE